MIYSDSWAWLLDNEDTVECQLNFSGQGNVNILCLGRKIAYVGHSGHVVLMPDFGDATGSPHSVRDRLQQHYNRWYEERNRGKGEAFLAWANQQYKGEE